MTVGLYQVPTANNLQYTLNSSYTAGGTTLTLNQSVAGVVQAPGVCVVDRIDSSGNKTPTKRTYYKFTGVPGAQLTGLSTVDGTDQAHSVGAIVEFIPDITQQQAIYDTFGVEHTASNGYHTSLASTINIQNINFVGTSTASIALLNTKNLVTASQASIYQLNTTILNVGTLISASGASVVGFPASSGTGGFNAVFQVPGALASMSNIGGLIPVPVAFTAQFAQFFVQTPASAASVSIVINKNLNTVFAVGGIAAGATFGSTASISSAALVAGDVLTIDINSTASLAQDLSVLLRAT